MRVAFYAPMKPPDHPTPSGDREMARLVIKALEQAGHSVQLACRFRSRDGRGDPAKQDRLAQVGDWLAGKLIERFKNDPPRAWVTYHLYYKAPDWLGPRVATALDIPYGVIEASHAPKRAGGSWDKGHWAVTEALGRADWVLALNRHDLACVQPVLRPEANVRFLPPFLDPPALEDRDSVRASLAARYHLPMDEPWLLTVAMMREGDKLASYQVLGKALNHLRDRPWRLMVVGDGAARAQVEQRLGRDRVSYLGQQPPAALPAIYRAADLFVWPAVNEAFGMVFLEAQAQGLPIVGGLTGGVPDVVRVGRCGLLPTVGDSRAFADSVRALLDDPIRRRSMGQAALDRVHDHHHLINAAQALKDLLS
ncbi:glycosyltransferase family 4 protein [Magnetospira sp. QH-2]|uniref:glycosyltransferase family 4 protein n=1 Tax=Magnetospira sp. (strain QH-2) TaxID=1288970 RepID=UPI0003E80BBF|nr:glycosyltransferase family 4 protein [Magnetospira sp. QH-2]CCQ74923.1 putative GT4 : distantly related to 1L-myo-inositol-1-P a-N-acetylglucoaminyltransferase [Magnetospira sp. QH-2]